MFSHRISKNLIKRASLMGLTLVLVSSTLLASTEPNTLPVVQFTTAQANAGEIEYQQHCASCHAVNLQGMGVVPAIGGANFLIKWGGKPVSTVMTHVTRMPPLKPNSLSDETYANIFAHMLQSAEVESGDLAFPSDVSSRSTLILPSGSGDSTQIATVLETVGYSTLLDKLTPVTTEMLNNPSPSDWLSWHRTNDSKGYSPLDQINKSNVMQLKSSWRLPLPPGNNMPTPLVHDGVMFFYTFPDTVLAIDATNGSILWRHQHKPTMESSRKMGIALHGNKVIVPTSDMRMLALDAKTGNVLWNTSIATSDVKLSEDYQRYDLRTAPVVAGDKVIQGVVASIVPRGSFIFALDVNSGKEAWRFHTLARPGEHGGNSWNDLPLDKRSGGSVWMPGSYDAELNLVYFGVAPTYDTQPMRDSINKTGVSNDALYTNSTLAFNPDTGELVWYYQHEANDQWDLDWAFERQIMELNVEGQPRKVVVNIGKAAILDALDAATGEYLFSIDSGLQNVISKIDPDTGEKTHNPATYPRNGHAYSICPSAVGARSWPPSGYNPTSKRLFVPLTEGCFEANQKGGPLLFTGINILPKSHPDSNDGKMGRLQAIDLDSKKLAWTHRQQTPLVSSLLATGGGLVFSGDMDPSLKVFDEANGKLLWQTQLSDNPSTGIVTYAVNGIQYIALVVGQTNNHVRDWSNMSKAYAAKEGWEAPPSPKDQGAAIVVFSLDEHKEIGVSAGYTPK
ncbi:MAG: PQQ-binding-like beta-propeller repeat protein [Oceanicoccus sp.]